MNAFKLVLAATGIATTALYMKKRLAQRSALGDPDATANANAGTTADSGEPASVSAGSPNLGERVQSQHFRGAGAGMPFGMSGSGDKATTHDDLLSPGPAKASNANDVEEDAEAAITPGLPDFSRGA